MPENFSLPSNVSNEDSGATPGQSFGQAPEQQEPEQRFSPPPSNVFIRTSESDLEKIKSEGGAISGMPPSVTPPVTPSSEQNPSIQGVPEKPAFSESEPSFAPEAPVGISEFPTNGAEPTEK